MKHGLLGLALSLTVILTGCGKAGTPVIPGSNFPRNYPDPNLAPTAPVRALPEDQPGLTTTDAKAKFTTQGSYIDPSVRATELSRGAVIPGSTLPYAQTRTSDGDNTPFTQGIGPQSQSPLQPAPSTAPPADPE